MVFLNQPNPKSGAAQGSGAVSVVVEGSLPTVYAEDGRPGTQVFHFPSLQTLQPLTWTYLVNTAPLTRLTLGLIAFQPSPGTYLIDTLRTFESRIRDGAKSARGIDATSPHVGAATRAAEAGRQMGISVLSFAASTSRVFVAPQQNDAGGNVAPTRSRDTAEKIKEVYAVGPQGGSTATARKTTAEGGGGGSTAAFVSRSPNKITSDAAMWPAAPLNRVLSTWVVARESAGSRPGYGRNFSRKTIVPGGVADWLEQKRAAHLSFLKVETSRVIPTTILLRAGGSGASGDADEVTPAPLLNRESATGNILAAGTIRAYEPATGGRRDSAGGGFTFLRREEQFRPPQQSYAFARPARPAPVEEPTVTQVRGKEVAEVVRREVETAMKSRSPIDSLSRSDYSRIADHVYSSLARRLLIDKERNGLQR